MPNTVALTTAISSDHTTLTVTDSTVYTDPTRAGCGVFLSIFKVNVNGQETEEASTLDNEDAGVTGSWTIGLTKDGHYRYKYIATPDYNVGTTYDQYDLVFDPASNVVYRSVVGTNLGNAVSNDAFWVAIPDPVSIVDNVGTSIQSDNVDTLVFDKLVSTITADSRDTMAVHAAIECCTDSERLKNVSTYDLLDLFVAGIEASEAEGLFSKGERIARRAESII